MALRIRMGGAVLSVLGAIGLGAGVLLSGAAGHAETVQEPVEAALPMPVTINEMMVSLVDPAASGLWRPAGQDAALSEADWRAVDAAATNLIVGATLTSMPGAGPFDAEWVADRDWKRLNLEMQTLALQAREAAGAQDLARLRLIGDRLVEVCEACHADFKPGLPTGGITRLPGPPKTGE